MSNRRSSARSAAAWHWVLLVVALSWIAKAVG